MRFKSTAVFSVALLTHTGSISPKIPQSQNRYSPAKPHHRHRQYLDSDHSNTLLCWETFITVPRATIVPLACAIVSLTQDWVNKALILACMLFSFYSRSNHKYYYNIFSLLPTFAYHPKKRVINMRIIWLAQCEISLGELASSLHAPLCCPTLMVRHICIKSHFPDAGLVLPNPFAAAITTSE